MIKTNIMFCIKSCWDCPYLIQFYYEPFKDENPECVECCGWYEKKRAEVPVHLADNDIQHIPDWCPLKEENRDE